MKSKNREIDVDNLIRGVLYSISASFGDRSNLKSFHKFNHNDSIQNLIDKNKFVVTESLFPSLDIKTVENNIRESLGLSEMKEESIVNLIDILRKIYTFIDTNKMTFTLGNIDKLEIINDVLENHIKKAIIDYDYTSNRIVISNEQDFSDFVSSVGKNILFLDNMLMKFPNDILGIDSMISNALKDIRASKTEMAKHGQVFIDPRETLLTSESILFKRIAVDENLYAYYKENNRTKLINNILFWKWSIALSY